MQPITFNLPRPVPMQKFRAPKKNVPQTPLERNSILRAARRYVAEFNPVPPMPADELKVHADKLVEQLGCNPIYRDYLGVLINNEMWREAIASVPFQRRLLLLPKCLRVENKCPAPFDEFGLLCKQCGLCSIQDLQNEAERLGYAVLVAEGSAIVMSLIQTGKIEAIVGVSCLSVLERAFPYMEAAAIPGVAIPLLQDDCIDTNVDLDWVWDYIHLTADDKTRRLDLGSLRDEVDNWFNAESLDALMGKPQGHAEDIAREWLMRSGKRWRPFLTVSTFQALRADNSKSFSDDLRMVAIAVECFHKASLVHDDIEDADAERYGQNTLHEQHGMPIALNVGDLLVGEGYRLLASTKFTGEQKAAMVLAASINQRELCRGQGAELAWTKSPKAITTSEVVDIFRGKTAPAFQVALQLGAICANLEVAEELEEVLRSYSEALGIAYQIRDDLADLGAEEAMKDIKGIRPSILLSVALERANDRNRAIFDGLWTPGFSVTAEKIVAVYKDLKVDEKARSLLETYKEEAIRSLRDVENASLKGLLRRVIGKIFNDREIEGWCAEFENKNKQAQSDVAA